MLDESVPGGQVKTTHKVSNYPGFPEDVKGTDLAKAFAAAGRALRREDPPRHRDHRPRPLRPGEDLRARRGGAGRGAGGDRRHRREAAASWACPASRSSAAAASPTAPPATAPTSTARTSTSSAAATRPWRSRSSSPSSRRSVTIIHQFDHFQAEPVSAAEALAHPKIEVIWNSEPRAFLGREAAREAPHREREDRARCASSPPTASSSSWATCPAPISLKGLVPMNEWGYVETGEDMSTERPGLYVAGDIRSKRFRQITTAVADGTIAALAVQKFVKDQAGRRTRRRRHRSGPRLEHPAEVPDRSTPWRSSRSCRARSSSASSRTTPRTGSPTTGSGSRPSRRPTDGRGHRGRPGRLGEVHRGRGPADHGAARHGARAAGSRRSSRH